MAAYGYRPRINGHHRTTIRFAQLALPEHEGLLRQADLLRRERHRAIYGGLYTVSRSDAEAGLDLARRLIPILKAHALDVLR